MYSLNFINKNGDENNLSVEMTVTRTDMFYKHYNKQYLYWYLEYYLLLKAAIEKHIIFLFLCTAIIWSMESKRTYSLQTK